MANLISIPDGNAFYLRITGTITNTSESADYSVITDMIVNFVRRGREAQEYEVDDSGRLVVYNDGSLACGTYGVEQTGTFYGQSWRFYQKAIFDIVDESDDADDATETISDIPVYDVAVDVAFAGAGVTASYVTTLMEAHESDLSAHSDALVADVLVDDTSVVEEVTDDDGNVQRIAHIDSSEFGQVDDVQINGESVVVDKIASIVVPVKVSDLENDSNFTTQDAVDEVAEDVSNLQELYQALTQTNIVVLTAEQWAEMTTYEVRTVYRVAGDGSYTDYMWNGSEIVPMATYTGQLLYNNTGPNTDGAMTQEAVSKEIELIAGRRGEVLGYFESPSESTSVFISLGVNYWWASADGSDVGKIIDVSTLTSKVLTIHSSAQKFRYAFLASDNCPDVPSTVEPYDYPDFMSGTSLVVNDDNTYSITVTIPDGCNYFYLSTRRQGVDIIDSVVAVGTDLDDLLKTPKKGTIVEAINSIVESDVVTESQRISMTIGQYSTSNGRIFWAGDLESQMAWMCNRKFLQLKVADTINSVDYDDTLEDLYVLYYDSSFTFISYTTNTVSVPTGTMYVRFGLERKSGVYTYDERERDIVINITHKGELIFVADRGDLVLTDGLPYYQGFYYEIQEPEDDDSNITESTVQLNQDRCVNAGFVYLPKNYTHDGKPCPLIIFAHGTSGFVYTQNGITSEKYQRLFGYLLGMGYAIADCSTFTNLWARNVYGSRTTLLLNDLDPICNLQLACYKGLYKYVTENFNVEKEVYLYGKSAGGMLTTWCSYYRPFPIKVAAALAPTVDIYTNLKILTFKNDINWWLNRLGISDADIPGNHNYSDTDKQNLISYWSKFIGFNPIWVGVTDVDFEAMATELVNTEFSTSALRANETLQAIVSNGKKILNVPLKIWQAEDDANVPIATSEMLVTMARNAGCQCYLRVLPDGAGHAAPDTIDVEALMTDAVTRYGGTLSVPFAYVEMVEWFERW